MLVNQWAIRCDLRLSIVIIIVNQAANRDKLQLGKVRDGELEMMSLDAYKSGQLITSKLYMCVGRICSKAKR